MERKFPYNYIRQSIHVIGTGPYAIEISDQIPYEPEDPEERFIFIGEDSDTKIKPELIMVGIAKPATKKSVIEGYYNDLHALSYLNSISLQAILHLTVKLGRCVNVGPFSSVGKDVIVRDFVGIGASVTIGHDCRIGNYSTVCPGAVLSGYALVGELVFIGAGAIIKDNITIGDGATIGCGAVVVKDVPNYSVMVGNPAKAI